MITQMIEDNGSIADLMTGKAGGRVDATPRQAPPVSPYPTVTVDKAEPASTFGAETLRPVTVVPGNGRVVGDMGAPTQVASGAPAKVGPGNLVSDLEPETGGPEDTMAAQIVGDMYTGGSAKMPFATQDDVARITGDLVTGKTTGGYTDGPGTSARHMDTPGNEQ